MAMVGAIVLARRDFLPDASNAPTTTTPLLMLTERPRELVSVSGSSEDSSE